MPEMGVETSFIAAFLVGLLGGVHCLGMCGGIVGALTLGQAKPINSGSQGSGITTQLAYNAGRISSYMIVGGAAGFLGAATLNLAQVRDAQLVLLIIAGLFMIALGLFLAGWWRGLLSVEKAGNKLIWRWIEPIGRRYIPVKTTLDALVLGGIWGWLPCGLVYSILIWSLAAGSFLQGALLMLGFGLGTLPNLLLMGLFADKARKLTHKQGVRQFAGSLVICFGLYQIYTAITLIGQNAV